MGILLSDILERLINTAIAARKGIIPAETDAFRLFDGNGDGKGGLFIDQFADQWLVSHRGSPPAGAERFGPAESGLWLKRLDQDNKEPPVCLRGSADDHAVVICELGIRYQIDLNAGYSQGLFLDQRDNRAEVMRRCQGQRVLNTFSYTCGFSVAAAAAGAASTTSLDLSRPYLDWGKQNFSLNEIDPEADEHHFCRGEAFDWLAQFARKQRSFDGVILDPPTFSRSKQRGVFRVEKDYAALAEAAAKVIAPQGWLLASCNHRGLSEARFMEMVSHGVSAAGRRIREMSSRPMPPDFTGEAYLKSVWVDIA